MTRCLRSFRKPQFASISAVASKPDMSNTEPSATSLLNALFFLAADIPVPICSTCAKLDMPTASQLDAIKPGDLIKVRFTCDKGTERMWVRVTDRIADIFRGQLQNTPFLVDEVTNGDDVIFIRSEIVAVS